MVYEGMQVDQIMEEVNRALSAPQALLQDLWRQEESAAPNLAFIYPPASKSLQVNLDRVARNWEIDSEFPLGSRRPGLGPLVVAFKRMIRSLLRWYINPIVHQERKYNMLVTQTLHDVANNLRALEERVAALEKVVEEALPAAGEPIEKEVEEDGSA